MEPAEPKPAEPKPAPAPRAPRAPRTPRAGSPVTGTSEAATSGDAASSGEVEGEAGEKAAGPKRRRRRGGRGRGRSKTGAGGAAGAAAAAGKEGDASAESATETAAPADAPAPEKAQPKRAQRAPSTTGSTRLQARAQRSQGRPRRPPRRLSEEEAKELRGSDKEMVIHEHGDRIQIAVLDGTTLIQHYVAHGKGKSMAGNVYLGRVQNVLSGMEAAFVDIGRGRNAVLYAGEVNYSPEDLEGETAPRIEKMLKPGQAVLVQVTKDPLGTKGARLTAQISLAGRYMVLAPEQQLSGISRRLAEDERSRLRQILRSMKTDGHGLIVRTAAEGATAEALKRDLDNLLKIWNEIKTKQKKEKAPSLLYAEPELVMRVARDIFSGDFAKVVVDSKRIYETLRSYLEETGPDLLERLELYEGALPIFEQFHIAEQIHKALERKVWLPSGGSIVIDRTEAMTVVDVNTSKFVGKGGSLEETVFKNNLEAAEEVARQLRLRDIGGIIVIDFIDMIVAANREQVLRTLKRALSRDKTRSQVFDVSSLGLVEMTRKKVSEGLLEAFSEPCPNCEGRGIVITHEID
jgi:ribonuclease E